MALIASTPNTKVNPSFISISPNKNNPQTTTLSFKSKLPISKTNIISKYITSNYSKFPICNKYHHHHHTQCIPLIKNYDQGLGRKERWQPIPICNKYNLDKSKIYNDKKSKRIWWSNVEVKNPNNVFVGRKWNGLDIGTLSVVVMMHVLALFAPFYFNWGAFWVAVALYFATGLFGICLSYHRNLSHRSFKLPKWLEYFFAYCGALALQGNPIDWVSTHRYHHQFCDSEQDPHSPLEGFWFSHMNWIFNTKAIVQRCGEPTNVGDLEKQPFYKFMRSTYVLHPFLLGLILYGLGGFSYLVWGMGVRSIWVYHITWFVNSACHVWGNQAWNTGDLSRNNWWVALLSFGEGWHNNHHAFEYSARHGLEWWQIDMTWYTIKLLQILGLAKDVKLPIEAHKQRLTFKNEGI